MKVYSPEEWEQLRKETERRFQISDEKFLEYRGYHGRVSKTHDNDTGVDEWCSKELSTNHRFCGDTLAEAEKDFESLVECLIAMDAEANE